jgi:hypothetical protein
MSYEGYTQRLCATGHLEDVDCYPNFDDKCSCGAFIVFKNMVDETNGCAAINEQGHCQCGYIPIEQFPVKRPAIHCSNCTQIIEQPLYDIPTDRTPHII